MRDKIINKSDFKLKVTLDRYNDICRDVYQYMESDFKHQDIDIFYYIEKIYKVSKATIEQDESSQMAYIRELTLYLLVNYSKTTPEDIVNSFSNITIADLSYYENDEILSDKYWEETKRILNDYKIDYLNFIEEYLHKIENLELSEFFDNINKKTKGYK
ncbi:MAG: hypothetical protein U9N59_07000 [Campylobacterota bacterium]|nr:hypothetical protein [Campylobacterota bacterium]